MKKNQIIMSKNSYIRNKCLLEPNMCFLINGVYNKWGFLYQFFERSTGSFHIRFFFPRKTGGVLGIKKNQIMNGQNFLYQD